MYWCLQTIPRFGILWSLDYIHGWRDLQEDLDELEAWLAKWLLKFNFDKCHVMHDMHVEHLVNSKYYLHHEGVKTELAVSNIEKDLCIWMSDDLKWSNQCSKSAAKAMSVLEMITRTFPYLLWRLWRRLHSLLQHLCETTPGILFTGLSTLQCQRHPLPWKGSKESYYNGEWSETSQLRRKTGKTDPILTRT